MNFPKIITSLTILLLGGTTLRAQEKKIEVPESTQKETVVFAIKGNDTLRMDIYQSGERPTETQPVMMFQFGGSFMTGSRDRADYGDYIRMLVARGFTVASIDYRLGMKGKKYNLQAFTRPENLSEAVQMAVEDLFSATDYLIDHASMWHIDPDSILTSGSSAGAISALQADWVLKNRMAGSEILPAGFTYKGIVGFAGGIFSRSGGPKWEYGQAAPTLMFHGSKDRTVPYRTIRFFKLGMFPSKNLERRMRRAGADYVFVDLKGKGHGYGAGTVMTEGLFITEWFLDEYVQADNKRQVVFEVSEGF